MTLEQLKIFVEQKCKEHPELKEEIKDLYQLALDEIEEGNSLQNEIHLCYESINDLIEM
jgi:hypothetical protein